MGKSLVVQQKCRGNDRQSDRKGEGRRLGKGRDPNKDAEMGAKGVWEERLLGSESRTLDLGCAERTSPRQESRSEWVRS